VHDRRAAYENAVRGLRGEADRLIAAGLPEEDVARKMASRRNALKRQARAEDDPWLVYILEVRNRIKYGDPVGPDADTLFDR
jgi:hypothetical protein